MAADTVSSSETSNAFSWRVLRNQVSLPPYFRVVSAIGASLPTVIFHVACFGLVRPTLAEMKNLGRFYSRFVTNGPARLGF